ncbi:MAG: hypothetical protein K6T30_03155 [Alicyclobacillus sp.]|nr:hypothetical protein [Alicyclobacillus sp.]
MVHRWKVGDRVRVQMDQGKRPSGTQPSLREGEIVHVGRRFAVVQFPRYRESFWLEDLRPQAEATGNAEESSLIWLFR